MSPIYAKAGQADYAKKEFSEREWNDADRLIRGKR